MMKIETTDVLSNPKALDLAMQIIRDLYNNVPPGELEGMMLDFLAARRGMGFVTAIEQMANIADQTFDHLEVTEPEAAEKDTPDVVPASPALFFIGLAAGIVIASILIVPLLMLGN